MAHSVLMSCLKRRGNQTKADCGLSSNQLSDRWWRLSRLKSELIKMSSLYTQTMKQPCGEKNVANSDCLSVCLSFAECDMIDPTSELATHVTSSTWATLVFQLLLPSPSWASTTVCNAGIESLKSRKLSHAFTRAWNEGKTRKTKQIDFISNCQGRHYISAMAKMGSFDSKVTLRSTQPWHPCLPIGGVNNICADFSVSFLPPNSSAINYRNLSSNIGKC